LWLAGRSTPALSLRGTGVPAIDGDRLVSGFDNGRLAAFSLARGSVYWEQPLAVGTGRSELERMVDVDGSIVVADGVVYAAAYQGRVAALTLTEGRLLWARDMSSYRGLSVDAERVYVTDAFGHVWALDRRNGGTLWQQDKLRLRGTTVPTPVGGQVVVGDYEGWLHWLAVGDGSFVARVRADSAGVSAAPIAGADGGIHVLGNGGVLSAYGPPVPTRE
ncbi:MAG: PQQ-binding-like beta-propeller repeat protein, partial [Ectothiorhodospiraceae bacterium]|nr:PQQ-binding-like beta-propeller repeat protein [Ectothiorhodospiraceae bacterium]